MFPYKCLLLPTDPKTSQLLFSTSSSNACAKLVQLCLTVCDPMDCSPVFPGGSVVKNLPAMQEPKETCVPSLGWEEPLKKGGATHFSVLAWRTPWTREPSGLQSMGSQKLRHDWSMSVTHSLPGSSVHRILQARILEWIVIPSSRGSSQPRDQTHASCVTCTAGGFFTPEHKCILFILNFWADIWFLVDTLESNYWLLHLKFNDSREIKWKRVRQIDNRIDQCQACFFPLLSSLLFRTLLCNFTITQKGNRNYLPLQIQRQEIRG